MNSSLMSRTLVVGLAVFALLAALFATAAMARSADPTTTATIAPSASQSATTKALQGALADSAAVTAPATKGERAKLRADLRAARAMTGQARRDAVKAIRAKALAGAYGPKLAKRADRRTTRRAAVFALLPAALQSDLRALRAAPPADRAAMRQAIRTKALNGTYGANVKAAAEKLQHLWKSPAAPSPAT